MSCPGLAFRDALPKLDPAGIDPAAPAIHVSCKGARQPAWSLSAMWWNLADACSQRGAQPLGYTDTVEDGKRVLRVILPEAA